MTKDRDPTDRPSFLYLLISLTIMVAIMVFPSVIHYGYSQKSDREISISSSSYTAPNEDGLGYYHVVGVVTNNSPTDSVNNVKIVSHSMTMLRRLLALALRMPM